MTDANPAPLPPAMHADRGEIALIVGATLLGLAVAAGMLAAGEADREATRLALRATARVSFVYFALAFTAAPLARLRPASWSRWLLRRRRAFGVAFGATMTVHVGCILRLYALYAPERPPMVTATDFLIGVPGLVLVACMTVTSLVAVRRRLADVHWRRLHRVGVWVVWAVFLLCLVDSVGRKETAHPFLGYWALVAVLVVAAALRWAAWRASGPSLPGSGRAVDDPP
ncbi:MAG: ferric reductase-like transmembrane domain-containing protein [Deltaproteobacteria bacterium]|nr:ferric reductase-like transmembrane domain-containing protein [Deltaproteobacteria bacterium]